ncbi:uncharacterized protein LOC116174652 [Photinus pyralis]|nr:uncharacterized protein LOC116174652 [Photinus pyralis]
MVISRNGSVVHSPKGDVTMPSTRSITKRVAELPSLRYGSIGNNSIKSGPLRVSESFPKEVNRRKNHLSRLSDPQLLKAARRVRFDLPPSDGGGGLIDADAVDVVEQTAGYDLHLPTRVTVSQHSDILKQGYVSQLYDARRVFANKGDLSDDSGVSVTISPASRYRVHPTGRYIRGTLSPTANSAAPAAASPGGIAILRAARDGDDGPLRDTLRRSLLVGISEVDLNAIDSSGRGSLVLLINPIT